MEQDDPLTRLRPCTGADLDAVLALQRQWAAEEITYGLAPSTREALLARLGPYFVVAEHDGLIVGYALGVPGRSEGSVVLPADTAYLEIEEIYVESAHRNRGVGGRLLDRLMSIARANGVERFLLYSATMDLDAVLRFYRSHGFRSWYVQMFQ